MGNPAEETIRHPNRPQLTKCGFPPSTEISINLSTLELGVDEPFSAAAGSEPVR
jgi:hypothetical protein